MKRIVHTIALIICFSAVNHGQNLEKLESGEDFFHFIENEITLAGDVKIYQDPRIHLLVNKHIELNRKQKGIQGYRIQIFSCSGQNARERTTEVRAEFLEKYIGLEPHVKYQPPFFKIRVGDFRTRNKAYTVYKKIVHHYPNSYIVRDIIDYPELGEQKFNLRELPETENGNKEEIKQEKETETEED